MSDDDSSPKPLPGLTQEKSPDFKVIYSNVFNYRVTLTDVHLVFSRMVDTGDSPNSLVQTQEVAVIMPLGQAKSLREYLTILLDRYERELGPIRGIGYQPPQDAELNSMFMRSM